MKKIIAMIVAIGVIAAGAATASAHNIYNNNVLDSKGQPTIIGVIPDDIWDAAMAKANSNISIGQTNMIHIPRGGTVVLKSGFMDTCPFWYPMGCVVDPSLVK